MVKEVKFEDAELIIYSDKGIIKKQMSLPISQVLLADGKLFVRLKLVAESAAELNLLCLGCDGKVIWRVQDPGIFKTGKASDPKEFYSGIWMENDSLWAHGTRGSDYEIDKNTGKIIQEIWTK